MEYMEYTWSNLSSQGEIYVRKLGFSNPRSPYFCNAKREFHYIWHKYPLGHIDELIKNV